LIEKTPCILQVSPYEVSGGAAKVALDLFHSYRSRGYSSYLAVGRKDSNDPDVFVIPNQEYYSVWTQFWRNIEQYFIRNHHSDFAKIFAILSQMKQYVQTELGRENFNFPGTYRILDLPPKPPHIVHAHNLHIDYFDLRALSWLSQQKPLIISMHDAWLLSGHCAHSFNCERWVRGCGNCPDLKIYPEIKRDATAYNWRKKDQIYSRSQLYIATASQWLMKKVKQSILAPAILEDRVIPYGVDLAVFRPREKSEVRAILNIPQDRPVLLTSAKSLRKKNYWMDFHLMRSVVDTIVNESHRMPVTILALGEERPSEYFGKTEIRYIPHQADHHALAQYYQAADLFVHGARADTFPLTVLEALSCGTPVVATKVGGIPEQIVDGVTGFLTPASYPLAITQAILRLLADPELCKRMGQNAAEDAQKRFDHERQVNDYLNWYQEILERQPNDFSQGIHSDV